MAGAEYIRLFIPAFRDESPDPPPDTMPDLLTLFLSSPEGPESEELLARLMWDLAAPVVGRIAAFKVRGPDAEDVRSDVLADLITHLRELKEHPDRPAVEDFLAYSAVAAYHGCNEYYRTRYPQRFRLFNRLRYLLNRNPRFALWEGPDRDWMCGWRVWQPKRGTRNQNRAEGVWARSHEAVRAVEGIFEQCSGPIRLDQLVDRVAHRWGVTDAIGPHAMEAAQRMPTIERQLERRSWLRQIWEEVAQLPLQQRVALLLHLRDDRGGPALALLPVVGVASLREIAAMLEMEPEHLAAVWNTLPMEDLRIAEYLQVKRQQVINLRRSARERLARRTETAKL